ncbi:MAG: GDP-mannose dehydrogenase [Candidatus Rokuibacteriota bacterium]|nr:MAG: GDP-mannose dehydrogenase [Candidatus Rokubacteria bacterium]
MRVSVFGLGYVGCVTAACLAKAGHAVVGVDVNAEKVAMINSATSPIVEPGLPELLREVVGAGRLRATTSSDQAVAESDLSLICVGTPSRSNGRIDVDAVVRTGQSIGQAVRKRAEPHAVVLRSTVLPGTAEQYLVPALLAGAGGRAATRVAVNPEFMREGSSLSDFARPPMTLVGCGDPAMHTSIRTAEMVKYAANAFHALKVCFANEVADVCAALGADGNEVMRVFAMDRKLNVSEAYLRPGFAFGGSCLPKDLRALLHAARAADVSTPVLGSILPSNEGQVRRGVEAVLALRRQRIGVVGLSFKAGTDDLRESPVVGLVETLIGKGCDVRILDRNVATARLVGANRRYIEQEIPHIASLMCPSAEALLAHAEVIVIGNACEDATEVLAAAQPEHLTIDLTRGHATRSVGRGGAGS